MSTLAWVVLITITLAFSFRKVYFRGYKAGATAVVKQWKQTLNESGDETND